MPAPNSHGIAIFPNRKEAIAAATLLETPAEALARVKAGGRKPEHYVATPPVPASGLAPAKNDAFDPNSGPVKE